MFHSIWVSGTFTNAAITPAPRNEAHHPTLVGFDLGQMEGDVSAELFEKRYPIAYQDRQDRITNFVGKSETKAFAGNWTASHKPDGTEHGPKAPIDELRKIA